jgi:hypothetical protein
MGSQKVLHHARHIAAALCAGMLASSTPALAAHPSAAASPLQTLRAPLEWEAGPQPGTRRAVARLGGRTVAVVTETTRGPAAATVRSERISAAGFGGPATDSVITFDGTSVTETDLPLGTLARSDGSTQAGAPCPRNVTCGRLAYRWTRCFQIDDGYSYAYQCFHVYSAGTTSKTLAYRAGWWTGTANSDAGSNLRSVLDRDDMTGCTPCGVRVDEWSPSGDIYPPGSGKTVSLGFGLSGAGVNANIAESLTVYSQVYGPLAGYPRPGEFRFLWRGNTGPGTSIGMAGGDEWQYRRASGYPWFLSITNTVCYPSWLC